MTEEEKRKMIAEACGWSRVWNEDANEDNEHWVWKNPDGIFVRDCFVPNYFHDLNAMHEAEKSIPVILQDRYVHFLAEAVIDFRLTKFKKLRNELIFIVARATAANRAEAFGLVLGLWKEGE